MATRFASSVASRLERRLDQLAAKYGEAGRNVNELGSADEIAARMMAVLPEPSAWDRQLGPMVSTTGACRLLGGISRQALAERRSRRTILALRTADGVWVYPRFQFPERGGLLTGLANVIQAFDPDTVDEWTVAGWLTARHAELGDRSVVGWLRGGKDPARARSLARQQAARYRR